MLGCRRGEATPFSIGGKLPWQRHFDEATTASHWSTVSIFLKLQLVARCSLLPFPNNLLVKLLGVWEVPQVILFVLIYFCFLTIVFDELAPHLWLRLLHLSSTNPPCSARRSHIHRFVHLFMASVCVIFLKTWIEVSGSGPRDIAKQLKNQQLIRIPIVSAFSDYLHAPRLWLIIASVRCTRNLSVFS